MLGDILPLSSDSVRGLVGQNGISLEIGAVDAECRSRVRLLGTTSLGARFGARLAPLLLGRGRTHARTLAREELARRSLECEAAGLVW